MDKSDRGTGVHSEMLSIPNLKELTIGPLLYSIPFYMSNLKELKLLKILAPTPPEIRGVAENQYANLVVEVPEEALSVYMSHPVWSKFWNIKASGVEEIEDDAQLISIIVSGSTISLINKDATVAVRIFSLQGTLLKETWENKVEDLASGIYIVSVGNIVFKIKI